MSDTVDPEDGTGMELRSDTTGNSTRIVKRSDAPGPQQNERKSTGVHVMGGGGYDGTDKKPEGVTVLKGKR